MLSLEETIEYQRQLLVYGDVALDAEGRVVMDRPAPEYWQHLMTVGGRGNGKTFLQRLLQERAEKRRLLWNILDDALARPVPAPEPASVHWRCTTPTGYVSYSQLEEKYRAYTRGIVDGLAGRDLLDIITDAKNKARGAW